MRPKFRLGDLVQLTYEAARDAQIDIHHIWTVISVSVGTEEFYYGCNSPKHQHAAWTESELTKPHHPFYDGYKPSTPGI